MAFRLEKYSADRLLLAAMPPLYPALIYGVIFVYFGSGHFFVFEITPADLELVLATKTPDAHIADLRARDNLLLTIGLAITVASAAGLYGLALLHAERGRKAAFLATLAALVTGLMAAATQGNPLRSLVVENVFHVAKETHAWQEPVWFSDGGDMLYTLGFFIVLAACAIIMLIFSHIALGDGTTNVNSLKKRTRQFRLAIYLSSAIMTSATISTYSFYHYPLAMMTPESARIYGELAQLASVHWGVVYSFILATTIGPALAALYIDNAKALDQGDIEPDTVILFDKSWISGTLRRFALIASILGPAAIGPLIEKITSAFLT